MSGAGSDKEDQPSQGRFNGSSAQAMAPTTAQPITPGFSEVGPSQEEGAQPLPCVLMMLLHHVFWSIQS